MQLRDLAVLDGIFEITIAVPDLDAAAMHWHAFGYTAGRRGALSPDAAAALYGLARPLQALRLRHGSARSGLIRLWQWEAPTSPGLGLAPMRTLGSRWSVHRSVDITPALAWAHTLARAQPPVVVTGPVVHPHGDGAASINLAVFTPLYRHVVLVRHGIDVPLSGTPDAGCLLGASEVCHAGLVISPGQRQALAFYEQLGLRRMSERRVPYHPESVATRMFPLAPGEALTEIDFDASDSRPGAGQRPGRLRIFLLESNGAEAARATAATALGYGPYTLRAPLPADTDAIDWNAAWRRHLQSLGAEVVGEGSDEFGAPSLRLRAPDGEIWLLSGAAPGP